MTYVASTVRPDTDRLSRLAPVRLFLKVRPVRTVVAATMLLGALTVWLGTLTTPIPTAVDQGGVTIPMWRLLAMGAAVLPALALHSPLADLEVVATRRLRTTHRLYLIGLCGGCAAIYLAICATTMPPAVLGIIARSWIAWFGLALIAGSVLGWRQAWTLPSLVAVALWYWGRGIEGYQWWEFSARPYPDVPSLILSTTLLAAGLTAYGMTPWRRRMLWRS